MKWCLKIKDLYYSVGESCKCRERSGDKVNFAEKDISGDIRPENGVSNLGRLSPEEEKQREKRDLGEGCVSKGSSSVMPCVPCLWPPPHVPCYVPCYVPPLHLG